MTAPKLVVVVGPTASGKTALACALAERLPAEVVSADSQQCYRGLDVATAKPTAAEQARARHHLLDVAWPEEQLDAARFVELAEGAIAGIVSRGNTPIVVGGTGLWIRALVAGLANAPSASASFRADFRAELQRGGLSPLFARLRSRDPEAAARIQPNDRVRIERALEIIELSGRTLSEIHGEHRFRPRRFAARVVHLAPPTQVLAERIARRTRGFFEGDRPLLEETRTLLTRIGQVPAAERALRIIGYQESADAIAAGATEGALGTATERIAARTRRYAKRQRTWFRKDADTLDAQGRAVQLSSVPEGEALDALGRALAEWYR